jgi:hypothetical protein
VVEPVGGQDGPGEGVIAREDDVLVGEGQEEGALHGPEADPGDGGELGEDRLVRQIAQPVGSSRPSVNRFARSRSVVAATDSC